MFLFCFLVRVLMCYLRLLFLEKDDSCTEKIIPAVTDNSSSDSSDEDEPPEPDTTLFIKNLNFSTNQEDIREVSIGLCHMLLCVTVSDDEMNI